MFNLPDCKQLIAIFIAALLAGCDNRPTEAMLENYSNRIANVLDSDRRLVIDQPVDVQPFPRRRDRIMPEIDLRQGLLEVLNLRHCRLIQLVAERNSSLGKVMPPSRQLVYEIDLYIGLRDCLEQLRSAGAETKLIGQIESVLRIKDDNLEAALWNGIFTSEAIERNFSLSEPALILEEDGGFKESERALKALIQIASLNKGDRQWPRPEYLDNIEQHYESLYNLRYGSRWLRSIALLTQTLDHTAITIEQKLQNRPFCFNKQATPDARILKNVFMKYYAGEVQPYLARVDQQGRTWLQLNQQLLAQFTRLPESVRRYQNSTIDVNSLLWQDYISARDRHTRAWQRILRQCGLMPGRQ